MRNKKTNVIHCIGIGGTGMSVVAEILFRLGYVVSGSDCSSGILTDYLVSLGISVFIGHDSSFVNEKIDLVVRSSAITEDNPEVMAARRHGVPVVLRAQILSDLMRSYKGIAVSGTHGKTTTTALISWMLTYAARDPTCAVGGSFGHCYGARVGQGDCMVVEADESDQTFLLFQPHLNVVTNIDRDHMGAYNHSMEQVLRAYCSFINNLPFYGCSFLCQEDPNIRSLFSQMTKTYVSYGFSEDSTIRACSYCADSSGSQFEVIQKSYSSFLVKTSLVGRHNVLNCLACIGVGRHLGLDDPLICASLESFSGVSRRFQRHDHLFLYGCSCSVVDDYGHHPVEVAATLDAARQVFENRRIILIFQPHRVTRTRDLFDSFIHVLSCADALILLPIYKASEEECGDDCSAEKMCEILSSRQNKPSFLSVSSMENMSFILQDIMLPGDVLLIMGAGSVAELCPFLLREAESAGTGES